MTRKMAEQEGSAMARVWTQDEVVWLEQHIRDKIAQGSELTFSETVIYDMMRCGDALAPRAVEEIDSMAGLERQAEEGIE